MFYVLGIFLAVILLVLACFLYLSIIMGNKVTVDANVEPVGVTEVKDDNYTQLDLIK